MQDDSPKTQYSIGQIADLTGVSRRTVRYYVQRGLLSPPTGLGRGQHYTQEHLEQIERIRHLQREGLPLESIARIDLPAGKLPQELASARESQEPATGLCTSEIVIRVRLREGVVLELEARLGLPSSRTLAELAGCCRRILDAESTPLGEASHEIQAGSLDTNGEDHEST